MFELHVRIRSMSKSGNALDAQRIRVLLHYQKLELELATFMTLDSKPQRSQCKNHHLEVQIHH